MTDAGGAAGPLAPAAGDRRRDPRSRLGSSLLLKFLAAFVLALVGSSSVTAFLASRLTERELRRHSLRTTATNLRVLIQAYTEREQNVVSTLRSLSTTLTDSNLLDPVRRNPLISELGRVSSDLQLDMLQVRRADGRPLDPPVLVGAVPEDAPPVTALSRRAPISRLLRTVDGTWEQSVTVPVLAGDETVFMVGGYDFDEDFAYQLRRQVGDVGHVVLVVNGAVVASTLPRPLAHPPGVDRGGDLPVDPVVSRLQGDDELVAYHRVGGVDGGPSGALGVLLADPERPLNRALAQTRLLAGALLAAVALALGWLFFRILVRPLVELTATARRIAGGDLEASFAARGADEVAVLAQSLERMRLEVRDQLELIATQASSLQDSSQRIVAAQDEERHRLARDLHDGIQQHLVVLRMGFGLTTEAAERAGDSVHRSLQELSAELDAVIGQLREVSHDLYPSILVDRGLAAALRTRLGRLPVPAQLTCTPDPLPRLPAEIESGAYFLVAEALTNALKHAAAATITVRLSVEDGWLVAEVCDDGKGFAGPSARQGGLLHMEDRARSFGGRLTIDAAPGAGCRVRAAFPVRVAVEAPG